MINLFTEEHQQLLSVLIKNKVDFMLVGAMLLYIMATTAIPAIWTSGSKRVMKIGTSW